MSKLKAIALMLNLEHVETSCMEKTGLLSKSTGLYCGTIPFGVTKGEDGVPIPDTQERNSNVDGTKIPVRKL